MLGGKVLTPSAEQQVKTKGARDTGENPMLVHRVIIPHNMVPSYPAQ